MSALCLHDWFPIETWTPRSQWTLAGSTVHLLSHSMAERVSCIHMTVLCISHIWFSRLIYLFLFSSFSLYSLNVINCAHELAGLSGKSSNLTGHEDHQKQLDICNNGIELRVQKWILILMSIDFLWGFKTIQWRNSHLFNK